MEYYGQGEILEYKSEEQVEEHKGELKIIEMKSVAGVEIRIYYYNGASFGDESYTDLSGQYFV